LRKVHLFVQVLLLKDIPLLMVVEQILDLIKKNYFESGKKIVVIHTGGLQGDTRIN